MENDKNELERLVKFKTETVLTLPGFLNVVGDCYLPQKS